MNISQDSEKKFGNIYLRIKRKQIFYKLYRKYFIAFGVSIGYFFISILALIFISKISYPFGVNSSVVVFLFLLLLNVLIARSANLSPSLKRFWSFKKVHFFFIGFFVYLLILILSKLSIYVFVDLKEVDQNDLYSLSGVGLIFIVVGWEELMFRGIILNYLSKFSSSVYLSCLIGFFFTLIHVFNPEMDMLLYGPNLFFAGALLTFLYFKFSNIWLPLGIHFCNNLLSSDLYLIIGYEMQSTNPFFVPGGYLDALILAIIYFILVYFYYKNSNIGI